MNTIEVGPLTICTDEDVLKMCTVSFTRAWARVLEGTTAISIHVPLVFVVYKYFKLDAQMFHGEITRL